MTTPHQNQETETPTGIEAEFVKDVAQRQQKGLSKYGTTVAENPLPASAWIQHAYEESLDLPIYLKRAHQAIAQLELELAALKSDLAGVEQDHKDDHLALNAIAKALFNREDIGYTDCIHSIVALKQDKERLDWLDKESMCNPEGPVWIEGINLATKFSNLRNAIDAAMQKDKP